MEGVTEAIGQPLEALFSGVECIAFEYEIFERVERSSGPDDTIRTYEETYYDGIHLTPSCIRTSWAQVKLLCSPDLNSFEPTEVGLDEGRAFVARTRFKAMGEGLGKLKQALAQITDVIAATIGRGADWCPMPGMAARSCTPAVPSRSCPGWAAPRCALPCSD